MSYKKAIDRAKSPLRKLADEHLRWLNKRYVFTKAKTPRVSTAVGDSSPKANNGVQ